MFTNNNAFHSYLFDNKTNKQLRKEAESVFKANPNIFKEVDEMFKSLDFSKRQTPAGYPPYNLIKLSENDYLISLALAGFSVEDINIQLEDNVLVVSANKTEEDAETEYVYRGIANRAFVRRFNLDSGIKVADAEMLNGMLNISLQRIVEEKKSTKIEIKTKSAPSFLND